MSTTIRPELSEKNQYWIEKHRYYELKHFCLQYTIWKKAYLSLDGMSRKPIEVITSPKSRQFEDPVAKWAIARLFYAERMDMLERIARDTDPSIAHYILKAVTEGVSYDYLKTTLDIPCCKETYYDLYRRFFWLLSQERG